MGDFYSKFTRTQKQPPKHGYGFLEAVVTGVISRAGALIEKLDQDHQAGGNPGFGSKAMLSAFVVRYSLGRAPRQCFP